MLLKTGTRSYSTAERCIAYCGEVKDYVSREIFLHIQENEGEHLDWLETRLELIEQISHTELFSIANASSAIDQSLCRVIFYCRQH